jgi:hypothetical protein
MTAGKHPAVLSTRVGGVGWLTSKAHQRAPYGLHAPSVGKRGGPRYPDDARREVIADLKAVAEARREIVRVWRGALHHINC